SWRPRYPRSSPTSSGMSTGPGARPTARSDRSRLGLSPPAGSLVWLRQPYEGLRSAVPTGRVKWYEKEKGFGFLTSDDGGDVFVHKAALPAGVDELRSGQRVEFGIVDSRKGAQALSLKLIESPPSVQELRRRPAEELHGLIED